MATLQTVQGTAGADSLTTDLLKDFIVDALAGDDTIIIEETAAAFEIQASSGDDSFTADGDVANSEKIKGGADNDTFNFKGAVESSNIYGGKGLDSLLFDRSVTGGLVSGDTGNDVLTFTGKIFAGATIDGGSDDDTLTFNERIEDSTILGGAARDLVDINDNSVSSRVELGKDNDVLTIQGKHAALLAKGNSGDDTITVEVGFSGSGSFYAGKDEDVLNLTSTAKVLLSGDDGDDKITVVGDTSSEGATLLGGDGDDTIDTFANTTAGGKFTIKSDGGDDSIKGSVASETIYGGKGGDTITTGANGTKNLFGDAGDDVITLSSVKVSTVDGGGDDDELTEAAISTEDIAGVAVGHTIIGGVGIDSIGVLGAATGAQGAYYALGDHTTVLSYKDQAELLTSGDLIDSITIANAKTVNAIVGGELTITAVDEFDRAVTGTAVRNASTEGLRLSTAKAVTKGSNVVISKTADDYLQGVDLSAGTTGNSVIDASAADNSVGMLLKGGAGRNTIKGGAGTDVLVGGAKADSITAGAGVDLITGGGGADTLTGAAGNDILRILAGVTPGTDTVKWTDFETNNDEVEIQTSSGGALVAPFTAVVDGNGSASAAVNDAATLTATTETVNPAAAAPVTLAAGGTDLINFSGTVGLTGLVAAMTTAGTTIKENGGGSFTAGDQMFAIAENASGYYEYGLITFAAADKVASTSILGSIKDDGVAAVTDIAVDIDFVGLA